MLCHAARQNGDASRQPAEGEQGVITPKFNLFHRTAQQPLQRQPALQLTTTTARAAWVVRLVPLRSATLSATPLSRLRRCGLQAGHLCTDLVELHAAARAQGHWLSAGDLAQATKSGQGRSRMPSTARACRRSVSSWSPTLPPPRGSAGRNGPAGMGGDWTDPDEASHHPKDDQTVVWKDQALRILPDGRLRLRTGRGRPPLLLPAAWIDAVYLTKPRSRSAPVRSSAPRGRRFRCPDGGARIHWDVKGNGANTPTTSASKPSVVSIGRYRRPRSSGSAQSEEVLDTGPRSGRWPRPTSETHS
jgi:hypothetical protein